MAATAAIPIAALAFAGSASAATVGDWAVTPAAYTLQPGSSTVHKITVECVSAEGCDYGTATMVAAYGTSGATFTSTGSIPLVLVSAGGTSTTVGTCSVAGNTQIQCKSSQSGHANQGDTFVAGPAGNVVVHVPASTPADTSVVWDHIASSNSNQNNDNGYGSTPVDAGTPMADWTIAGGVAGGLALLAGAGVLARRRRIGAAAA